MLFSGKILVAGANGGTGRETMRRLAHHGVSARAMARSEEKLAEFKTDGFETVVADVRDRASLDTAVAGVDAVICCVGTRVGFSNSGKGFSDFFGFGADGADAVDNQGTRNLVEAMRAAGVNHLVIVTSMLINQPLNPFSLMMKPFGDILKMKDLAEKTVRESGLRYTIVRPGGLTNQPALEKGIKVAPADALSTGAISRADVAEVCVQALVAETAFNKTVEIVNDDSPVPTDWREFFNRVN